MVNLHSIYRIPDTKEPFTKLKYFGTMFIGMGVTAGVYNATVRYQATTYRQFANYVGYWLVPIAAVGVSYAASTYIIANVRQKDGPMNHFLGAIPGALLLNLAGMGMPIIRMYIIMAPLLAGYIKTEVQRNRDALLGELVSRSPEYTPLNVMSRVPKRPQAQEN